LGNAPPSAMAMGVFYFLIFSAVLVWTISHPNVVDVEDLSFSYHKGFYHD